MPINKIQMPSAGQYVYITKSKKTQLPIIGKVKRVHSLSRVQCITENGIVDVGRTEFALTKEEAIEQINIALDNRIAAAQQRIEESQELKKLVTQIAELPSPETFLTKPRSMQR